MSCQVWARRFESLGVTWLKVTNDLNAVKPDMKLCHLDVRNVNFLLVCRWAGKAEEVVVVVLYFWRGYQQPSDIGLSDRTSVALGPPLAQLGQAFLSVSRHRPPSHHISLSFSLFLSPLASLWWLAHSWCGWANRSVCVHVCMCVRSGVSIGLGAGLREKSAPGQCGRQRAG